MAEHQSTQSTTPAQRVALIRSIVGHAAGRESESLATIQRVLEGDDIQDLISGAPEVRYNAHPEITWAAYGLMHYLLANGVHEFDNTDALALNRAAYRWHPSDRGDFEGALNVLQALGYVESDDDSVWRVYTTIEVV